MLEATNEIEYKGLTIRVIPDESPESPREWDNLGTMVFFHNRYNLGDTHSYDADDYSGWDEMEKDILRKEGPSVIYPVYMYDHSGLAFSMGETFYGKVPQGHAYFDSGQIGFIFVTKKKIREEYGKAGKKELERVEKVLEGELDTYEKYCNGWAVGYELVDPETEEVLDSCWGFYEEENMVDVAKSNVDYIIEEREKMAPTREREAKESEGQLTFSL